MKLDTTPQLDFGDVLIRPKRTILSSRSEVQVRRTFTFPHCKCVVECVPIIASNMDTTGTFNVYDVLVQFQILTFEPELSFGGGDDALFISNAYMMNKNHRSYQELNEQSQDYHGKPEENKSTPLYKNQVSITNNNHINDHIVILWKIL